METKPTIETVLEHLADMKSRLISRFDTLETKFEGLETRLDRLETKFEGLETRLDRLETKFEGLETRLDRLETKFEGLETRLDRLETKFEGLETRFNALETQVAEGFKQVLGELKLMNRKLEVMTQDNMDMRARIRDVEHRMDDIENEVRARMAG